ncbi:hypothetical protein ACGF12_06440 [Kitasatospora sp. NPDC048296]|uniref:hypothetical protein n=1 Tax=Kitasatospora sp. NPDC048296 TaxID=3364048 RepID=UPI0037230E44
MTVTRGDRTTRTGNGWLRRALALIGILTCLYVGVVLAYVYVGTIVAVALGFLYLVAVGIGVSKLGAPGSDPEFKEVGGSLALAVLVLLMATGAGADAWHNMVLSSGRDVRAVVVTEHVEKSSRGSTTRTYTLVSRGEGTVPGGPLKPDSERFESGDTVTVRMDPAGRVAPKLPGEADSPASLWLAIGLNAGFALILLWFAHIDSRPRRMPRPAGPWREGLRRLDGLPLAAVATAVSVPWLLLFLLVRDNLGLALMVAVPYPFAAMAADGALARDEDRKRPQGLVILLVVAVFALGGLIL